MPGAGDRPTYPDGRFLPLPILSTQPADRPPRGGQDLYAYRRLLDDQRRQPPETYVRGNMFWKGSQAHPLSADERENLLGFPADDARELQPTAGQHLEYARRHAIGKTRHVSSLALILSLVVCPLGAQSVFSQTTAISGVYTTMGRYSRERDGVGSSLAEPLPRQQGLVSAALESVVPLPEPILLSAGSLGRVCR